MFLFLVCDASGFCRQRVAGEASGKADGHRCPDASHVADGATPSQVCGPGVRAVRAGRSPPALVAVAPVDRRERAEVQVRASMSFRS